MYHSNYDTPLFKFSQKAVPFIKFLHQWHFSGVIFIAVIILAILDIYPLLALVSASLFIQALFGVISCREIIEECKWSLYLTLALSRNLGVAVVESKMDTQIADLFAYLPDNLLAIMSVLGLTTLIITSVTNNAAAVSIMLPVAYKICQQLSYSEAKMERVLLYVTILSSIDLLTPYGYQTNLIVQPIGRYTFINYFKMGLIISLSFYIILTPIMAQTF